MTEIKHVNGVYLYSELQHTDCNSAASHYDTTITTKSNVGFNHRPTQPGLTSPMENAFSFQ